MREPTTLTRIAGFETSSLRVYKNASIYRNHLQICIKSEFFNDEDLFHVVCDSEKIVIKRYGFGYVGKTTTPTLDPGGFYHLFLISEELPLGHYEFDEEESDTDNLVCYWSEQI
jgi:hypothetical protein